MVLKAFSVLKSSTRTQTQSSNTNTYKHSVRMASIHAISKIMMKFKWICLCINSISSVLLFGCALCECSACSIEIDVKWSDDDGDYWKREETKKRKQHKKYYPNTEYIIEAYATDRHTHTVDVLNVETIWVHLPLHSSKLHTTKGGDAGAATQIW